MDRRGVAEPNQRPASVKASLSGEPPAPRLGTIAKSIATNEKPPVLRLGAPLTAVQPGRTSTQCALDTCLDQDPASLAHASVACCSHAGSLLPFARSRLAERAAPPHPNPRLSAAAVAFGQRAPNRAGAREQGRGMGADLQRES